jgi:energy-coupling factor transport system ATP-binding protein
VTGHPPPVVFEDVTVTYADAVAPTLRSATFEVEEGELVLVVGRTGAGKSTLLGAVNGTVPHFTGGRLSGRVRVTGLDTRDHRPRDLAGVVGVVRQDPSAGFVTDTVEEELAYTLEQLAVDPRTMRRRVEEVLDLLGIAELRDAPLRDLSGGQQQRVAIGAVLTAHPRLLVLDEPTSALDPVGAEDVLATLTRLVHDVGLTVLVSEHRLERIVGAADRVLLVEEDGSVTDGPPREVMRTSALAPPVVRMGRWAGWEPLPLTIREARRSAAPLRRELATASSDSAAAVDGRTSSRDSALPHPLGQRRGPAPARSEHRKAVPPPTAPRVPAVTARGLSVHHGAVRAVTGVDLDVRAGEVAVLMGRNGSGKSSLLWALHGSGRRTRGSVEVSTSDGAVDPTDLSPARRRRRVGLVPQDAADLLYLDTVSAECRQADGEAHAAPGTARALLDRLAPGIDDDSHPRDLSEGQRLALVVAVQLTAGPRTLLLDEPTRGLDYPAKGSLASLLRDLATRGHAVLVATHDVEFAAEVADRVVVMADGEVVADGEATAVLGDSPAFAPQVARVVAPAPILTLRALQALRPTAGGR